MKIFITGGTTGIGWGLAEYYLKQGHEVAVAGRDCSKLPEHAQQYARLQRYDLDVLDGKKLIESVAEFADGQLDMMIANAGISVSEKSSTPNFDKAHQVISTNVLGVLNAFEAALNVMYKAECGHLVATASFAGLVGLPGAGAYSASKAAVLKLCESYCVDLRKIGVSVTALVPGFVDTPLTQKNKHGMPFLMSVDKAVEIIVPKLEKKKPLIIFPKRMYVLMYFLDRMPRVFYRFMMQFYKRK